MNLNSQYPYPRNRRTGFNYECVIIQNTIEKCVTSIYVHVESLCECNNKTVTHVKMVERNYNWSYSIH